MVQVSETYDLSTTQDKMGLIGIHTPQFSTIKGMWGGLCENYKFFRVVSCDVALACASMLPVDPLQIGTETGSIAPQDMFNPMLYRAVSNDAFETILARIYSSTNSNDQGSVKSNKFELTGTEADQWDLYYGVLADPSWRKAMPQSGLEMRGLYPLVYSVVNTYGPTGLSSLIADLDKVTTINQAGGAASTSGVAGTIRGPPMRMPRIPTRVRPDTTTNPTLPTVYVGAIVCPPAKLNKLYYRMRVTWTIEFSELISTYARSTIVDIAEGAPYWSDWVYGSSAKDADKLTDANLASTKDVDIKMVMSS